MKNGFEDILFLFNSSKHDRKYIRMNLYEAGLLFKITTKAPGDILEIGTKFGGSAILLAVASGNRKVYSVDVIDYRSHKAYKEILKFVPKELLDKIEFIVDRSSVVGKRWKTKMGLIFIDGKHTPRALSKDIDSWKQHVVDGGYMVFHDIGVPTTKMGMALARQLLKVVRKKTKGWRKVGQSQSLIVMQNVL